MDFLRGDLMFRLVMSKIGKLVEFQFEDGDNVSAWRTEEHENYGNVNERVKKTYIGYIIGGAIDLVLLVVIPIAILAGA